MGLLRIPFDTNPLTAKIDRRAVQAYATIAQRTVPPEFLPGARWRRLIFPALMFVVSGAVVVFALIRIGAEPNGGLGVMVGIGLLAIPAALALWMWVSRRKTENRWLRLRTFAEANGLQFHPLVRANGQRSGTKFTVQGRVDALNVIAAPGARNLMIGTLRVESGTGKSRSVTMTDFVTLSLKRRLPHIVLDAKSNNGLGWNGRLGAQFDREQRLRLEGDFNDTFTLYCPRGYEADALHLFTPDIMARMQDHAADWDVEIIDDEIYLYSPKRALDVDPQRWQAVGTTINALGEKLDQWERWRESRGESAPSAHRPDHRFVAYEGRRLTSRFPWWMWLLFAYALFGLVMMAIDTFAVFGDVWQSIFRQ